MTETIQIKVPMWNIESETGYKPRTTFWQDFSIADAFWRGCRYRHIPSCVQ